MRLSEGRASRILTMGFLDFLQPATLRRAYRDAAVDLDAASHVVERAGSHSPAPPHAVAWSDVPDVRRPMWYGGEKWSGGLGSVELPELDYWTLRARSSDMFRRRLFARGIIRRVTSAVVTAGLFLEATPAEQQLGMPEASLEEWAEDVEMRFTLWGKDPFLCDAREQHSFGALQEAAFREALVAGDVLVTLVTAPGTRIPRVRLIRADCVQTPINVKITPGHRVVHGVELDAQSRQVAYWIAQTDGGYKRLPAWGEKSGRRLAWLVYATDRRLDDVRGEPLLSLVLQSIADLDRYRDSALRKALVNSFIAMWVEKTEDKPGSRALAMGAQRVDSAVAQDQTGGATRRFESLAYFPGQVIDETQTGEKIHFEGGNGTDASYSDFEEAIVQGLAWALEIPPEILRLAFSSNYSASKAAENNWSVYLYKTRTFFGEQFCQPIYVEWLLAETLNGHVTASGLLDSWRDPLQYVMFGAWTLADWCGNVKPSVDPVKQVAADREAVLLGFKDPATAAREYSGQKLSRNLRRLKTFVAALADAGIVVGKGASSGTDGGEPARGGDQDASRDDDGESNSDE